VFGWGIALFGSNRALLFLQKWMKKAFEQVKMEAFFARASKKEKAQYALQHTIRLVLVHLVH